MSTTGTQKSREGGVILKSFAEAMKSNQPNVRQANGQLPASNPVKPIENSSKLIQVVTISSERKNRTLKRADEMMLEPNPSESSSRVEMHGIQHFFNQRLMSTQSKTRKPVLFGGGKEEDEHEQSRYSMTMTILIQISAVLNRKIAKRKKM